MTDLCTIISSVEISSYFVEAMCPAPEVPVNGKIATINTDQVRYACNSGFTLSGSQIRYCRNGNYQGSVPRCIGKCLEFGHRAFNDLQQQQQPAHQRSFLFPYIDFFLVSTAVRRGGGGGGAETTVSHYSNGFDTRAATTIWNSASFHFKLLNELVAWLKGPECFLEILICQLMPTNLRLSIYYTLGFYSLHPLDLPTVVVGPVTKMTWKLPQLGLGKDAKLFV